MSEFTPSHAESIVAACRENLAAGQQALNRCLQTSYRLEVGDSLPWTGDAAAQDFHAPGLRVSLGVGAHDLAVLIPAAWPLPDWCENPSDEERERLNTLASELAASLLPADLAAERTAAEYVPDLWDASRPAATDDADNAARMLEIRVFDAAADPSAAEKAAAPAEGAAANESAEPAGDAAEKENSAQPRCRLLVVWPAEQFAGESADESTGQTEEQGASSSGEPRGAGAKGNGARNGGGQPSPLDASRAAAKRLLGLPVVVSVRLAERKIEMGQLLALTPGSLITFNKPCEELLDLYVKNRKYCRGEAVKIGEKFGLKISQVGVVDVRKEQVL